jgi:glycosyltransferase involved in cell wall biosynthesis
MKILFVLPLMTGIGGIQASLVNLLNQLKADEYEVSVCVLGNNITPTTLLPSWVNVVQGPTTLEYCLVDFRAALRKYPIARLPALTLTKVLRRTLGYKSLLRATMKRYSVPGSYDVAIAYTNDIVGPGTFVGGANDIVKRCVSADRRLAWIHNDPRRHGLDHDVSSRTYAEFDSVVNVSGACKVIFDGIVPEYAWKSRVVYNFLDAEKTKELADEDNPYLSSRFHLVTVARLDNHQKRIDRVIECCVLLKSAGYTEFIWHVVGDGPDASMLRDMARIRNVEDVVRFEGGKSNPFPYMKNADVFVLTSDFEAYPMSLREALLLGVPVVSTEYSGAAEIVNHGRNGLLTTKSVEGLYGVISGLMRDDVVLGELRTYIADNPVSNALAKQQFEDLISREGTRGELAPARLSRATCWSFASDGSDDKQDHC